jgi:hypothetical protein
MKVGIPLSEGNFLTDLFKTIKVPTGITNSVISPSAKQIGEGLGKKVLGILLILASCFVIVVCNVIY